MAFLKNSTNIPDKLVAIMVAFAMPPDCNEFVSSITVKNKRRGKVHGQFGWYYHSDMRVIVIVPRVINRNHVHSLRHIRKHLVFSSRAEFLVMMLAHELRHAWQHKHWETPASKWKLRHDALGKYASEADAELYEMEVLERWKRAFSS